MMIVFIGSTSESEPIHFAQLIKKKKESISAPDVFECVITHLYMIS